MDIFNFSYKQFEVFILIFVRISSLFILVPVFGSKNIPFQVKAGLSLIMSIVISSLISVDAPYYTDTFAFMFAIAREVSVGMVIGYASRLVFTGVQLAGHLMGFQIGFAIVNVFDPTTDSQISIISEIKYIFAVLIFLSLNAHYWIIRALVESFDLIPLAGASIGPSVIKVIIGLFGDMFTIALKIAAPVIASILFINVSLGVIAKTVPQMNVFIVGFPLQIGMGLMVIGLSMPLFYYLLVQIFNNYGKSLLLLLRTMQ